MMSILLDASLRSLLLGLAVWIGLRLWRVRNPQIEATAWIVVLSAALSMPLLLRWPLIHLASTAAPPLPLDLPLALPPAEPRARALLGPIVPALPLRHAEPAVPLSTLVPLIYVSVAGAMLLRLLAGLVRTWQILRRAVPVDPDWARGSEIEDVDMRVTEAVKAPVTVGSVILLPVGCDAWSPAKKAAVLCHERSHIAHHDFTVQLLSRVHTAIFWFSPLAWWLQLRLAYLAETTSDEAAVRHCGNRIDYAEILLDLAVGARDLPSSVAMARPAMLRQRIDSLLSRAVPGIVLTRQRRLMLAGGLLPAVLLVGGTAWHARAEDPPAVAPANPDPAAPTPSPTPSETMPPLPVMPVVPAPAAEPAVPRLPAAERPEIGSDRDGFVIIDDGNTIMRGGDAELGRLMAARRDGASRIILFRHEGKIYQITDPALVQEVASLFRPQRSLGEQQRGLGERQRDLGRQQSELGRQETEIGRRLTEFAHRRQVGDQVRRALAAARAALAQSEETSDGESKDDPDLSEVHALSERAIAEVSRELDQLTRRSLAAAGEALGSEKAGDGDESAGDHGYDHRMAEMSRQMEQLAERQRELASKQEVLSAQQEALSREQSTMAHDAEAEAKALIARALASGAATPVP